MLFPVRARNALGTPRNLILLEPRTLCPSPYAGGARQACARVRQEDKGALEILWRTLVFLSRGVPSSCGIRASCGVLARLSSDEGGAASVKRSIGTTTSRSVAAFVVGALCMMKAGRLVRVARCWSPPVSSPPLARPSTLLCFLCAAVRTTGNMPRQDMANGVRRAACLYSCALLLCWQSVQNPPSAWRTAGSGLGLASASCSPRATLSGACGLVLVFRQGHAHM